MSPFKALYGRDPPNLFDTYSKPSHNQSVHELLTEREEILKLLKSRIARAQEHMTEFANRHRRDIEFAVGDKVLLRLQPYRQHSVAKPLSSKLGRRYYGPFEVLERVGKVAYRLNLPLDSRVHDVFHISLLKPFVPPFSLDPIAQWPGRFRMGYPIDTPVKATAARTVLVDGIPQDQWQISWASDTTAAPSWEPMEEIQRHFPDIRLEGKAAAMGGGVDRDSDLHHPQPSNADPSVDDGASSEGEETRDHEETASEEGTDAAARVGPRRGSKGKKHAKGPAESGRPRRASKKPAKYEDFVPY